ncbi:hypothetical protein EON65_02160 [archaeon]|nr:MAG: hypothetical protein EON65_02160 [archaeon]
MGRRSLLSIMEPMFQLRLDLANNAAVQSERSERSHHIQADYANLKLLQTELQRAVDEYAGVHNQRVSRYIS